ncbi:protein TIFY 6B-like protein [Cinnamomum micranthum f. kanehirae]|uniref:Protein TIFY n=1 Tax=Cinnamomum micranthum f. kanehirae TaxID=337451 RepID=A0A3S3M8B4_9MAGN|nr:protein TIFY 6B-like protein [Cinnamomum micranthum f. kanehirae]
MERDFMGLNSKDLMAMVKEETVDGGKDQVFMGGCEMQRAFSNKVSALPHFMSFKAAPEERPRKIIFDPLASSAFQPIPPTNVFSSNHKPSGVSQSQKTFNLDRHSAHSMMQTYPFNSVDASYRSHEIRTFPVSNHSFTVAMTNPIFKIHSAVGGLNVTTNSSMEQPLGVIPATNPNPVVPFTGSVAGTYTPSSTSKPLDALGQLTIFYGGAVNVYNDISPEKAQAIMLLAGNGSPVTANAVTPRVPVPSSVPKYVVADGIHGNQSHAMQLCSGLSSPMSVTSHSGGQSGGASSNTDDLISIKTIGVVAPRSQPEPPKTVTSLGSTAATLMPSAVPQARKASLARFLEKRKERVTNAAPYPTKSIEDATGADIVGFAGKSQTSVVPLSSKDQS